MKWIESGSPRAPVWIVAEAPGETEIDRGVPLCGASGAELDQMLHEAGWQGIHDPSAIFRTNICHTRPPSYQRKGKWIHNDIDQFFPGVTLAKREGLLPYNGRYPRAPVLEGLSRLESLIQQHRPRLVISLGASSLWGLCGKEGITKWRGSVLEATERFDRVKVVATQHPSVIVDPTKGQYTLRPIIIQDLRRALRESKFPEVRYPQWSFTVAPSLADVKDWLVPAIQNGTPLVSDTEGWGVVDCIGFAASTTEAVCIPFVKEDDGLANYWSLEDHIEVFGLVVEALRRCPITFHNAGWDMQVICKNWGVRPNLQDDTMLAQHVAFPGLLGGKIDPVTGRTEKKGSSLSLSFCASMYCDQYRFWKDDGRLRNPDALDRDEWTYNCEDCCRTWEIRDELVNRILPGAGLVDQYRFMMSLFGPVLKMMFRGLNVDMTAAAALRRQVKEQRNAQQQWLDTVLGYPLNVHSTAAGGQMQTLLYEDLHCEPVRSRTTGTLSTDDNALETIGRRQPLLVPLMRHVQNIRSLDTNEATFLRPVLGGWEGKRWRAPCSGRLYTCLNIPATETFRFSSNETAFGEGCNLQNLTRPPEDQ